MSAGVSGILRRLMCFGLPGLMVGSLWILAASTTIPSIPPWREGDEKQFKVEPKPTYQQTAAIDHELDYDVDDHTTAAMMPEEEDDAAYGRRT